MTGLKRDFAEQSAQFFALIGGQRGERLSLSFLSHVSGAGISLHSLCRGHNHVGAAIGGCRVAFDQLRLFELIDKGHDLAGVE